MKASKVNSQLLDLLGHVCQNIRTSEIPIEHLTFYFIISLCWTAISHLPSSVLGCSAEDSDNLFVCTTVIFICLYNYDIGLLHTIREVYISRILSDLLQTQSNCCYESLQKNRDACLNTVFPRNNLGVESRTLPAIMLHCPSSIQMLLIQKFFLLGCVFWRDFIRCFGLFVLFVCFFFFWFNFVFHYVFTD